MNSDIDIILVNQNEIVECIKGYETSITITVTGTYQSYYLVVDSNGLNNASIVISKLWLGW